MLRVLSVVWALVAALTVGFVPPAGPQAQVTDVVTMGAAGISGASPTLSARRARAKIGHQEVQADGHHPGAWPHVLWLLATARPFAPDLVKGAVALVAPPIPALATGGTARTSRGPPLRA